MISNISVGIRIEIKFSAANFAMAGFPLNKAVVEKCMFASKTCSAYGCLYQGPHKHSVFSGEPNNYINHD